METPSYTDYMLEEAQACKENSNETMHGPDDALSTFFDRMDMVALEDFSGLGHLEVQKKNALSAAG